MSSSPDAEPTTRPPEERIRLSPEPRRTEATVTAVPFHGPVLAVVVCRCDDDRRICVARIEKPDWSGPWPPAVSDRAHIAIEPKLQFLARPAKGGTS